MYTIYFVVYALLTLFWIYLLASGAKRYAQMIEPLDSKQYMLKNLYAVGFRFLELIRYSYNTPIDRIRIAQARIVFGDRFGEYYYRVNVAEKFTYAIMMVTISPLIGPIMNEPLFCLLGLVAAGVMYKYADSKITDIIKKRETEIGRDFADMVSKMALLINAGMITREAWEEIAYTGEGTLYDEMRVAVSDMENGVSEVDAYVAFSNRCGVQLVKKFVSMLAQNISKGNAELVNFLKAETVICWEEKKHIVRREGEAAANKMMIPLGMILVGIFIMILVPVLGNMGI